MRRARWIFAWNVLALLSASVVLAAGQSVDFINGIGLIDYSSHPVLKPGAWVMANGSFAAAITACGVTPQAQNTGISSASTGTASP